MKRRDVITLLGGAAAWPLAARAQQSERVRRVGVLIAGPENDPFNQSLAAAFRQRLKELGWSEGDNLRIDFRWGAVNPSLAAAAAAELVRLGPDVILVSGYGGATAAQHETTTIPIVFAVLNEPIAEIFAGSLARPRGNVTGSCPDQDIGQRRLKPRLRPCRGFLLPDLSKRHVSFAVKAAGRDRRPSKSLFI
jgi:putative ABC transport system substrate-binding protein